MRINTYTTHINEDEQNFLVKESSVNYTNVKRLSSPSEIVEVMQNVFHMGKCGEEHVYMIGLNSRCVSVGFFEISHGTVSASLIQPREVLIRALLAGASGIILCHNHPGNSPTPSRLDGELTSKLGQACGLVGIMLHDHIIVCRETYFSFREAGLL